MRKALLLTLAAASIASYGQELRLGNYYHRQQKQKSELRKETAANTYDKSESKSVAYRGLQKGVYIDQAMKMNGNNIYRYVFAYNKNMERSSETIYKKYFNGVEWSDEELYNKGVYTYEYDNQGRIVSKRVVYEKPYTEFDSYTISVDYNNDDYTLYTYIITDDGDYCSSEWSFWKNGNLRHYTVFDGHASAQREERSVSFDQNGNCTRIAADYKSKEFSGNLNDSTIITNDTYDGYDNPMTLEHYVYNPENGKLTEYKTWSIHAENRKYEYIYDALGRISAIKKYYDADEEDAGTDYSKAPAKGMSEFSTKEPEWRLEYNETYTYFNDEVYGIGNPWHDIFGMDGPLTNRHLVDDDYEPNIPWVEDLTFNRDANGKLLSLVSTKTEEEGFIDENTFTVDANGHITRQYVHSKESWEDGGYNEETITTDYNWQGELLTSSHETSSENTSYAGSRTYTRDYSFTYDNGTVGYKRLSSGDGDDSERSGSITKLNKGFKIVEKGKYEQSTFIQEVQTEDISFVRPNLICDYEGFSTDSTIIVSVKDRAVAYMKAQGYSYGDGLGWHDFEYSLGEASAYVNTNDNTYFSVSHEDDKTICSNAQGLPVFVLQGNRLLKERIYEELYADSNVGNMAPSRASIPDAYAYKEITYSYDENGLVNGQTVTTVDENGTKVDETKVEVVYNPASGIESINATTGKSLYLCGRTLGMTNGSFSVYTLDGTMLANDASSFQFEQGGTYIVKSGNGKAIKVNVR